jgi:general secretion pathway protein G
MSKAKRVRSRRRGFTLLEVLLVVGILALLAAFVVPTFLSTSEDANKKLTAANMGGLTSPLELFHQALGRYPKELKELYEKPEDENEAKKWTGPYIDSPDKLKDAYGNEFKYLGNEEAKANQGKYDLWSTGKDGQDGTEDDITNWKKEGQ